MLFSFNIAQLVSHLSQRFYTQVKPNNADPNPKRVLIPVKVHVDRSKRDR